LKKIFETLQDSPLLQGIAFLDFEQMLTCLSARTASYQKGEIILLAGDTVRFMGLIVAGSVRIVKEDREGHSTILTELTVSESFGEVLACAEVAQSPVTVQAAEDVQVLLIDYRRIVTSCRGACPFHAKLIENMLKLLARKTLVLNQKIDILSKRITREKLLCYFDMQRGTANTFTLPFNRDQLARYLCVDRSAMSSELGKMRDEGLIRFHRNEFEILQ